MMGISLKRFWLVAILACAALTGPSLAAAPLAYADDLVVLGREARERHAPILLAFMQKTCPYCARARRHLEPLQASAEWGETALMREVDVDSTAPIRDFDGNWTTSQELARRYGIRMVPTIIVFDDGGGQAAKPLVGIASDDFYSYSVVQALEAAKSKVRAGG